MKIAVIGAGSWGTAIAQHLATCDHDVSLWARRSEVADAINANHHNPDYLTDFELDRRVVGTSSLKEALQDANATVIVTPSRLMRQTASNIAPYIDENMKIIICSKGVEEDTGLVPVQVFAEVLGNPNRVAALSGPNHAEEIVGGSLAGAVVAGSDEDVVDFFQQIFASETFRIYTSDDVLGVELCAAYKNVIAIAVGMSYGLGYGDNTAAMLMTRGLAEMGRLVTKAGGDSITCMGLAGTGDLIVTCMSKHSRNRRFGMMLAQGYTLDDFTTQTHMVAEGAIACKSLFNLGRKLGVDLPIASTVREIAWDGLDPHKVPEILTSRSLKPEFYGF